MKSLILCLLVLSFNSYAQYEVFGFYKGKRSDVPKESLYLDFKKYDFSRPGVLIHFYLSRWVKSKVYKNGKLLSEIDEIGQKVEINEEGDYAERREGSTSVEIFNRKGERYRPSNQSSSKKIIYNIAGDNVTLKEKREEGVVTDYFIFSFALSSEEVIQKIFDGQENFKDLVLDKNELKLKKVGEAYEINRIAVDIQGKERVITINTEIGINGQITRLYDTILRIENQQIVSLQHRKRLKRSVLGRIFGVFGLNNPSESYTTVLDVKSNGNLKKEEDGMALVQGYGPVRLTDKDLLEESFELFGAQANRDAFMDLIRRQKNLLK